MRLLGSADFKRVFERAKRSSDRYWLVLARRNDLGHPRLGLAISKKHAARAVDRNRLKRLVRESFRIEQTELGALDLIVMARPGTLGINHDRLTDSLHKHWRRLQDAT